VLRDELFERGLQIRREMFGPEGADRQVEAATDFTEKLQEMVTRNAFGDVWARDGLTRRERSMLTIAMLLAMGRSHEVRIHVRGAVANGVTREEIREILLHAAVYCGIPAAVDGFISASQVLDEQAGSSLPK
jgi:4-carboxymuconolactone decarboxylase